MWFPHGVTITLHHRSKTGVDGDNNDIYGWTDYTIHSCAYWPAGSTELTGGRDTVSTAPSVAVPLESMSQATPGPVDTITDTDEITVRGKRYEIDGEPEDYGTDPFDGWEPPLHIRLGRVTG